MGLEILRFSQNDKLNDTLSISAVVVLGGWLVGELVSWLVGWLVGWFVGLLVCLEIFMPPLLP